MSFKELLTQEIRTIRELRYLTIEFDPERCSGTWQCYEVCPIGLWTPNHRTRVVEYGDAQRCIACGACVLQCQPEAIKLVVAEG